MVTTRSTSDSSTGACEISTTRATGSTRRLGELPDERVRASRVDARGGLIEDEHREAREHRACECDALRLPARDECAALADLRIQSPAILEPFPKADSIEHLEELLVGGRIAREEQVLPHILVEEPGPLLHEPDDPAHRSRFERRRLDPAEPVRALVVEEAHQHVRERGLARSGCPAHEHPFAGRQLEVEPVEGCDTGRSHRIRTG